MSTPDHETAEPGSQNSTSAPDPVVAATRSAKKPQALKPSTAATKLDILLAATPDEFRQGMITRTELEDLQRNPPQWLVDLRRTGPHPRSVVAARLRVSRSALVRHGLTEPQTTEQIEALLADAPAWLGHERAVLAQARRDEQHRSSRVAAAAKADQRPSGK
jgi:hypothetical protein